MTLLLGSDEEYGFVILATHNVKHEIEQPFSKSRPKFANVSRFWGLGVGGYRNFRVLLRTLHPCSNPRRLSHFTLKLVGDVTSRSAGERSNKKLSYCWETGRRDSMPRIAEMDVEMRT